MRCVVALVKSLMMLASSEMLWPRWAARRSSGSEGSVHRFGSAGFHPANVTHEMVPVMGTTRVRSSVQAWWSWRHWAQADRRSWRVLGLALRQRWVQASIALDVFLHQKRQTASSHRTLLYSMQQQKTQARQHTRRNLFPTGAGPVRPKQQNMHSHSLSGGGGTPCKQRPRPRALPHAAEGRRSAGQQGLTAAWLATHGHK